MAKYHWQERQVNQSVLDSILSKTDLPLAAARVAANRLSKDDNIDLYIDPNLQHMLSPLGIVGLEQAAQAIAAAVIKEKKFLIHGDFDADGISSCALLTHFFRSLNVEVVPFVPNRLKEGHGLSLNALKIAQEEACDLVITCDCGSSNKEEIEQFRAAGIDVIITDHHQAGDSVDADCIIVNPQLAQNIEYQNLAGVGVAFMLCVGIRSALREKHYFDQKDEPNLKQLLDIVALGTIADLTPLKGLNRLFVKEGLRQLSKSQKPGIVAMRNCAGISTGAKLLSEDVGFKLAPRINAAARLGYADVALETLLAQDVIQATELATKLETYNTQRKSLQKTILSNAKDMARRQISLGERCIVLCSKDFHPGINGLVAQQLSQEFAMPAIVFYEDGEIAKGSARSFSGFNLMDLFEHAKDHMLQYGGHKQAGGGSVAMQNFSMFLSSCQQFMKKQANTGIVQKLYDGVLEHEFIKKDLIEALNHLGPFGMGHEEPLFKFTVKPIDVRCLSNKHLKFKIENQGQVIDCIGFDFWQQFESLSSQQHEFDIIARPEINVWQGYENIQLRIADIL
ncbi:MAG TPA: single-stranded-DNA-specific exonuclease RecJ [Oligoflexia bacterium]|nr:single-stranded-DNA-specific exonuclease RecJ [Oligoflexia bacterium]HMR24120.1 single-stranded-DNA-specific exonuclease RecJ [Oligoflexia bacterium]